MRNSSLFPLSTPFNPSSPLFFLGYYYLCDLILTFTFHSLHGPARLSAPLSCQICHHGSLKDQQDHHPAGDRLGLFPARIEHWYVLFHASTSSQSAPELTILTGYAVHSLALVADSFHMVRASSRTSAPPHLHLVQRSQFDSATLA